MSLLLSLDLKVLPTLLELLDPQTLSFDSKLEVELPALLERLLACVGVSHDVIEEPLALLLVHLEDVLDDFEAEDLLLELGLVTEELLLLKGDLTRDHGLSAALLLACQFPLLEGETTGLQFISLAEGL